MPKWSHKVVIPQPITELCTRDILVMEYLHGKKLVDGIRDSYKDVYYCYFSFSED
jgi:aarF domain-containing kinase